MLDLIVLILCCWLGWKVIKLAFKTAWGLAKIAASILLALAVPMLIGCLLFAGGIVLMVPVAMLAAAFGLLKACV